MPQMKCIDCSQPLTNAITSTGYVRCECGLKYSVPLLNDADVNLWERVRIHRLFDRIYDEVTIWSPPREQRIYRTQYGHRIGAACYMCDANIALKVRDIERGVVEHIPESEWPPL